MATSLGRSQAIGIGRQSTQGTGVTADYWIRKLSFDEGRNSVHQNDESALGVSATSSGADLISKSASPQFTGYVDINSFGLLMYHNAETYSVTTVESGVYDHKFRVGTSTKNTNWLTINSDDPTEGDTDYVDAVMGSIEIPMNMQERMMFDASFTSEFPVSGSNTASFTTAPQYFFGRQATVSIGSTVANLSSFGCAKTFNVSIQNNIDEGELAYCLGDEDINEHEVTGRSCEISMLKLLKDATYLGYDEAVTARALRVAVADTDTTIGSSSNPTITYTFPECTVKTTPSGDNDSRRVEDLVWTAHYGEDDDQSVYYKYEIVVRNTVADYSAV